jgi:signal transduction histidine kinase
VRARVLDLAREVAPTLGVEPAVDFAGPVDVTTPDYLVADLLATLREALSNVARHARAAHVEVRLRASADEVVLTVADDGTGPPGPDASRGRGLDNMASRATRRGGSFDLRAGEPAGTVLTWRVPLDGPG